MERKPKWRTMSEPLWFTSDIHVGLVFVLLVGGIVLGSLVMGSTWWSGRTLEWHGAHWWHGVRRIGKIMVHWWATRGALVTWGAFVSDTWGAMVSDSRMVHLLERCIGVTCGALVEWNTYGSSVEWHGAMVVARRWSECWLEMVTWS